MKIKRQCIVHVPSPYSSFLKNPNPISLPSSCKSNQSCSKLVKLSHHLSLLHSNHHFSKLIQSTRVNFWVSKLVLTKMTNARSKSESNEEVKYYVRHCLFVPFASISGPHTSLSSFIFNGPPCFWLYILVVSVIMLCDFISL